MRVLSLVSLLVACAVGIWIWTQSTKPLLESSDSDTPNYREAINSAEKAVDLLEN